MSDATIKYPVMRWELCDFLNELRDIEKQRRLFQVPPTDENNYCTLDDYVHYFYDDTDLSREPESYIGINLLNEKEVAAIVVVTNSIDRLIDRYNWSLTDKEYLDKLEVVEAARAAHALICPCVSPIYPG